MKRITSCSYYAVEVVQNELGVVAHSRDTRHPSLSDLHLSKNVKAYTSIEEIEEHPLQLSLNNRDKNR